MSVTNQIDRTRQKIIKDTEDLNNIFIQFNLMTVKYTFLSACG